MGEEIYSALNSSGTYDNLERIVGKGDDWKCEFILAHPSKNDWRFSLSISTSNQGFAISYPSEKSVSYPSREEAIGAAISYGLNKLYRFRPDSKKEEGEIKKIGSFLLSQRQISLFSEVE